MATVWQRINAVLLLLVLFALVGVIAIVAPDADGGPLDPPGVPGSTMKTLDDIPGSWHRVLPANDGVAGPNPPAGCDSSRFECLEAFNNDLVLDRETGLVWERDTGTEVIASGWDQARSACASTRHEGPSGYRRGFRLPTYEELQSLVQDFVGPPPLPPGHPFILVTDDFYWTATSTFTTTASAFKFDGTIGTSSIDESKSNTHAIWCVRGGQGYDGLY